MLFSRPDTPKSAPSRGSICIPIHYMFPGPTQLIIPHCTSTSSAVFAQLTADSPYTLQCVLERA